MHKSIKVQPFHLIAFLKESLFCLATPARLLSSFTALVIQLDSKFHCFFSRQLALKSWKKREPYPDQWHSMACAEASYGKGTIFNVSPVRWQSLLFWLGVLNPCFDVMLRKLVILSQTAVARSLLSHQSGTSTCICIYLLTSAYF